MGNQSLSEVIERHPQKVSGKSVFRGARVTVSALFENLKDGASIDDFLEWFRGVRREQLAAILNHEFAAISEMADV